MNIQLDDGVQFGIGVFETICLEGLTPILLDWHLERINKSLECFHISQRIDESEVIQWLSMHAAELERDILAQRALKIMVSEKNKLFLFRGNPYTPECIAQGFNLAYSSIMRNETSPLVYHKTMNYGDNILEKRRLHDTDVDEVIFLNSKGQISEGSTTNIFFAKQGILYTPDQGSGLLPGILRRFVMEHFNVIETTIEPTDVDFMDECFVTNSLMGIMPVNRFGDKIFEARKVTEECIRKYFSLIY